MTRRLGPDDARWQVSLSAMVDRWLAAEERQHRRLLLSALLDALLDAMLADAHLVTKRDLGQDPRSGHTGPRTDGVSLRDKSGDKPGEDGIDPDIKIGSSAEEPGHDAPGSG